MVFKILYLQAALTDLEEVFEWSRANHQITSDQFADDLFNHIEFLRDYPNMGPILRDRSHLRRLVHSPFIIYYRVNRVRMLIEILHIRHSSRRPPFIQ